MENWSAVIAIDISGLRYHIRAIHEGIRFQCPICFRLFTREYAIREHMAREYKHINQTQVLSQPLISLNEFEQCVLNTPYYNF